MRLSYLLDAKELADLYELINNLFYLLPDTLQQNYLDELKDDFIKLKRTIEEKAGG